MPTIADIRDYVSQWLNGHISLREFEDWFVPSTWDAYRVGDPELESLVDEIELNLSEYSDHTITIAELRKELAKAIDPFVSGTGTAEHLFQFVIGAPSDAPRTSTATRLLKFPAAAA